MMFTRKDLARIILPLVVQQVLAVTIGMADSMMVSVAGETTVSGVSLVTSLDILLIVCFSALASGGAIVISQFVGQNDLSMARNSAKQLIYVTTGVATLITVIVVAIRYPLLSLLFGDVEEAVMTAAQDYFFFIALSFPFLALFDAGSAVFRANGNSMISMVTSVIMNCLNLAGNAILIFIFDMGAAGAAISTLFSRIVGGVIVIALAHCRTDKVYLEKMLQYRPNGTLIKRILKVGIPSGLENGMFQFGKLLTQSLISSMGTAAIAANAVAHTLANFHYMPGNAVGLATVTVVGRCIGAGEKEHAIKYSRLILGLTYLFLWLIVILSFIFANPIISIYNLSAEAASQAHTLIIYHAIVAAVIWPVAFTLPGSFRAASDVRFPLIVSAFSMWAFRVSLSYVLALETVNVFGLFTIPGTGLGVLGVWIAMTVDWLFRAILFAYRHLSGRWLSKYKALTKNE
ncbi:MAG: MATE family efflux transporter [Clostridia bacterium]|nr:MATE family efflux transporter [Clostridia bacterium]